MTQAKTFSPPLQSHDTIAGDKTTLIRRTMPKLTDHQIDEYFKNHLPYRTRIMLAHYKMTHDAEGKDLPWTGDAGQLDACFIASLVTARLYLNILAVGKKDGKLSPYEPKPDDVTVRDLKGTLVDLQKMSPSEKTLLYDFLIMADKAAAHFTTPIDHDWTKTHDVIRVVHRYLQTHLYDHAGRVGLETMS